jgi:hypothetical protein
MEKKDRELSRAFPSRRRKCPKCRKVLASRMPIGRDTRGRLVFLDQVDSYGTEPERDGRREVRCLPHGADEPVPLRPLLPEEEERTYFYCPRCGYRAKPEPRRG